VPELADWCLVDALGPHRTVQRVAVAHAHPEEEWLVRELQKINAGEPSAGGAILQVLESGKPRLIPEVTDAILATNARDAQHLQVLRALRPRSAMMVPLLARGRLLGTLTLVSSDPSRRYGPPALTLAEDFARRAALAVDNARLYREAQDANRLKDEFLGIVSHELRTPLTAIFAWVRLLRARRLDEAKAAMALVTIERNARAQAQVIDDLLDVSGIVSGKLRVTMTSVDLGPIMEAAREVIRPAAEAKGVRLESVHAPGGARVLGDAARLQQIVWNLLANAVKFTPSGGRVELRLTGRERYAEIRVCDTGKGISPDFLPHVFERFRQADSTSTRLHGGLGLGLAIVRHLVELHGGSVEAESAGEDAGATFTLRLPLTSERPATADTLRARPTRAREQALSLEGVRVLAVDDNGDAREFITMILEECGALVRAAGSVGEALAALDGTTPDVLIGDITMPGEDGYVLIERVRAAARGQGRTVPAIALTACAGAEDRRRALDAGYELHLPKPFEPVELISAVAQLAGRTRTAPPAGF
jgi:signal transduction histidine kinase/ActR/RegA family two-component response regulator